MKAAAEWWRCDPLALMRDPERDVLVRRALIAMKAEADSAAFREAMERQAAEVGPGKGKR